MIMTDLNNLSDYLKKIFNTTSFFHTKFKALVTIDVGLFEYSKADNENVKSAR